MFDCTTSCCVLAYFVKFSTFWRAPLLMVTMPLPCFPLMNGLSKTFSGFISTGLPSTLVFLSIDRRHVVHFNVTEHPTAAWTAQQVVEAFPWDSAPRYLLRDRDGIYGDWFRGRVKNMGIEEVLTAPHSPWQNPYSERINGSIRRECLDWTIIFSEGHLRRILKKYFEYYNRYRVHQFLEMDAPDGRKIQGTKEGNVIVIPHVGGLHHHYERKAA